MIAVTEATIALLGVASIGATASIAGAWMTQRARKEVAPGNGANAGQTLDLLLDKAHDLDDRVDAVHVVVTENGDKLDGHIAEMAPLVEVFLEEHPKLQGGR